MTSHRHGGSAHSHVLPKPGTDIARRELIVMGLAGGLVPSPSALVVLLGAISFGRIWFGAVLVVAYGVGLALTLIATGLLFARLEHRLRAFSSTRRGHSGTLVMQALPMVSACALVGGGALLALRSAAGR